jgi:hypothetical protein
VDKLLAKFASLRHELGREAIAPTHEAAQCLAAALGSVVCPTYFGRRLDIYTKSLALFPSISVIRLKTSAGLVY